MTSAAQLRPDSLRTQPGHAPKSRMLLGGYTANLPRLVIEIRNTARARRPSRLFAPFSFPAGLRNLIGKVGAVSGKHRGHLLSLGVRVGKGGLLVAQPYRRSKRPS